ncbi:MAG: branched-chain amino acid ABC transporter permease [Rubellimicrobium sp.]|nr:branched-chain amino acid ABC transporter permease [Rubellimicrobium sp.]
MTTDNSTIATGDEPPAQERVSREGATGNSRWPLYIAIIAIFVLFWVFGAINGKSTTTMLNLTVEGIMLGGILALGSVGLTLVYGVLKFSNFAHGDMMTIGAFVAFALMQVLPGYEAIGSFSFGWGLLLAMILAAPVVAALSLGVDFALFRPLRRRGASVVLLTMASLAAMFFLRSIIYLIWGADYHFYYQGRANPAMQLPFGITIQADKLFILVLALLMVGLVWVLLERTRMGKAMRATANNPDLAQVRGINTERVIQWTWIIAGSLAALGGVMYGLASQVRPEMGFVLLLPLFAGTILGGIGSPVGAFIGAMIIGVAFQLSSAFIDPTYGPGVAFMLMILVLIVRPMGLFTMGGD